MSGRNPATMAEQAVTRFINIWTERSWKTSRLGYVTCVTNNLDVSFLLIESREDEFVTRSKLVICGMLQFWARCSLYLRFLCNSCSGTYSSRRAPDIQKAFLPGPLQVVVPVHSSSQCPEWQMRMCWFLSVCLRGLFSESFCGSMRWGTDSVLM